MTHKLVFGFGSLINQGSLRLTAPGAFDVQPSYIQGFKRNFSVWDPIGWTKTNQHLQGIPFAALDIQATSQKQALVNGVVFKVSESDFAHLVEREREYTTLTTIAFNFADATKLGECTVFSAGKNNGSYVFDCEAQTEYLDLCLEGAEQFGEEFYQTFLDTTFIGNQQLGAVKTSYLYS